METVSLEERVYMFSRVLDIMSVFEELNNFTGLVALYSALNSSSVYRLKACREVPFSIMLMRDFTGIVATCVFNNATSALLRFKVSELSVCLFKRIDREKQTCFEKFQQLCNPHWKEMIERLKSINPPCVPFFGKLSRLMLSLEIQIV